MRLHKVPLLIAILAVIVCAATSTLSQRGGKAEPMRITFKRGTNSSVINDRVSGSEEAEYVLTARKGQRLTIHLTSVPRRSAVFDLKGPENADLGLEYDANYDYSRTLPVSGDYTIIVTRPTTSPGRASYRLVVTVR